MKRNSYIITYIYAALSICCIACSSESISPQVDNPIPSDEVLIEVEAPNMDNWNTEVITGSSDSASTTTKAETGVESKQIANQTIVLKDKKSGLDMQITTMEDTIIKNREGTASTRWTNLNSSTYFRVVAYKCINAATITTSNYAGYGDYQLQASTVTTIKTLALPTGTYTFVCYSYGKSTAMNPFSNATSITVSNGEDLMTCIKPNITIDNLGSIYTLTGIVFQHKCAAYRITAVAQGGRMTNITACSATLILPNSSASYSFTSNELTTNKTAGTLALSWSSPNAMSVNSNYVYILPLSSQSITPNITLTIGGKAFSGKTATINGLTFGGGAIRRTQISFTTTQGYIVGGCFWANGNLHYSNGSYLVYNDPSYYSKSSTAGDYWNWNTLVPCPTLGGRSSWSDTYDPCRKISPANTWRSPTNADCDALINTGYVRNTYNSISGATFGGILFFPYSGLFSTTSTIYSDDGTRGLYWVNSGSTLNGDFFGFTATEITSTWGSNATTHYMSVRCVKN